MDSSICPFNTNRAGYAMASGLVRGFVVVIYSSTLFNERNVLRARLISFSLARCSLTARRSSFYKPPRSSRHCLTPSRTGPIWASIRSMAGVSSV